MCAARYAGITGPLTISRNNTALGICLAQQHHPAVHKPLALLLLPEGTASNPHPASGPTPGADSTLMDAAEPHDNNPKSWMDEWMDWDFKINPEDFKPPPPPHLHKLVVQHGVRPGAGGLQEGLQALAGPVVHAVGAHHVQLVQAQVLLHRSQRLDLATDELFRVWHGSVPMQIVSIPGAAPLLVAPGLFTHQQVRIWQGQYVCGREKEAQVLLHRL